MLLLMRMVTNIFIYIVLALLNQRIVIQNILILIFFVGKKPSPFPSKIVIDYMGGGSDTIQITKDNIKKYFPCVKWVDVDYNRKF